MYGPKILGSGPREGKRELVPRAIRVRRALLTAAALWLCLSPWQAAQALRVHSPPPTAPVSCTVEGVFPGLMRTTRWTMHWQPGGAYTVESDDAQLVAGLVQGRFGSTASLVAWRLTGQVQSEGLFVDRSEIRADLREADGTARSVVIVASSEETCEGPDDLEQGRELACHGRVSETWWSEAPSDGPRGSAKEPIARRWRNDGVHPLPGDPAGRRATRLVATDADGLTEHHWMDAGAQECPLLVQRIRIGQVVGQDRLVSRQAQPAPAVTGPSAGAGWLAGVLLGGLGIVGLVIAVVFFATRAGRKRAGRIASGPESP